MASKPIYQGGVGRISNGTFSRRTQPVRIVSKKANIDLKNLEFNFEDYEMWAKLIEIVLEKWLALQTPERKAAQLLVALLSGLRNCQNAYLRYLESPNNKKRLDEWRIQVESLAMSHSDLQDLLDAFILEANRAIGSYVFSERLGSRSPSTKGNLFEISYEFAELYGWDVARDDFEIACEKLREFIQENYEPHDTLGL